MRDWLRLPDTREMPPLPEGYSLAYEKDIYQIDIQNLRRSVGWFPDTNQVWKECLRESLICVGAIEDQSQKLIAFTRLSGDRRQATLADGVVHPDYQNKGLGKIGVETLIKIADLNEIRHLTVGLAETNTLGPFLREQGFNGEAPILMRHHAMTQQTF